VKFKADIFLQNLPHFQKSADLGALERIQLIVSKASGLGVNTLKGSATVRNITEWRQLGMYLSLKLTKCTLKEVGQVYGGRLPSTVSNARDVIEGYLLVSDPKLLKKWEMVKFVMGTQLER